MDCRAALQLAMTLWINSDVLYSLLAISYNFATMWLMQWNGRALILSTHKFDEYAAVVRLFSDEHGLYSGVCKSAFRSSQRGVFQAGNLVQASWKARLEEHLGSVNAEIETPYAALAMQNRVALAGVNAMCALVPLAMQERDPHAAVFDAMHAVLQRMTVADDWLCDYVRFELLLLKEAGFGLDLRRCVATQSAENLVYVSPKSGGAVSAGAGAPYHDKMLKLPSFLMQPVRDENPHAIADGLALTGYFLQRWMLDATGHTMPAARNRLVALCAAPALAVSAKAATVAQESICERA